MIYIRKIFTQDLRDGKQIAFPTEPSNVFFKYSFANNDSERKISFKFKEKDNQSNFYQFNDKIINTRLYSAISESRVDAELKRFLIDDLNAMVEDIIVFKFRTNVLYEFEFIPQASTLYNIYMTFLENKNHEIILNEQNDVEEDKLKYNLNNFPINKIYFGAPGTGKSHRITEDLKSVNEIFQKRVTFHPEYDNASFIGSYKPIADNGDIKYEFVPQIFINIFVEACNDPNHQYYLIIEEINRGNCAEIFGEYFQLLDRDPKYNITPSTELVKYLDEKIILKTYYKDGKMNLPNNLSILATMNTSDQSLFPMDSAFKRRWEWEYIPINLNLDDPTNLSAKYKIRVNNNITFKWLDFIDKINQKIQNNRNLGMDKCIGNYFIKPDENNEIAFDKFIHKVFFYLWNDVFKDEPIETIFKGNICYQNFFPIHDSGVKIVLSILDDLEIEISERIEFEEMKIEA